MIPPFHEDHADALVALAVVISGLVIVFFMVASVHLVLKFW